MGNFINEKSITDRNNEKYVPYWLFVRPNIIDEDVFWLWYEKLKADLRYWKITNGKAKQYGDENMFRRTTTAIANNQKWLVNAETFIQLERMEAPAVEFANND